MIQRRIDKASTASRILIKSSLYHLKLSNFSFLAQFQGPLCDLLFLSFLQGRCTNFTVLSPSCTHASCSPKLCLPSNRDCLHLTKPSCSSRIVIQPSGECFGISQGSCGPKICLKAGQECLPVTPTLCSKACPPSQKCFTLDCSQSSCPNRCTQAPSRMLPLLPPHTRQSVETLCQTYPCRPSSKEPKF